MYYELAAKLSKGHTVTTELKVYGEADSREQFETKIIVALEEIIRQLLNAHCTHHDGPFESRIGDPL